MRFDDSFFNLSLVWKNWEALFRRFRLGFLLKRGCFTLLRLMMGVRVPLIDFLSCFLGRRRSSIKHGCFQGKRRQHALSPDSLACAGFSLARYAELVSKREIMNASVFGAHERASSLKAFRGQGHSLL